MDITDLVAHAIAMIIMAGCMLVVRQFTSSWFLIIPVGAILGVAIFLGLASLIGFLTNTPQYYEDEEQSPADDEPTNN